MKRHLALTAPGIVLINTDVHGNGEDFRRMEAIFRQKLASERVPVSWVVLGDVVHGPSPEFRGRSPELYDYEDESAWIVSRIIRLQEEFPGQIHFVLGNHDYAHIGGRRTAKFYGDEAEHLEDTMDAQQIEQMHALFLRAFLLVSTSCGVLMAHGAPGPSLERLDFFDDEPLPIRKPELWEVLRDILYAYGQREVDAARMLESVSSHASCTHDDPLRVVIHGHDRDEDGWYADGYNQFVPVIFGAPRENRRYLCLDLSQRYESVEDLRLEHEVLRLYA